MEQIENNQSTLTNNEKLIFEFLKSFNLDLKEFKNKLGKLSERIDLLEKNQILLFNRIFPDSTSMIPNFSSKSFN